jgi:protease PrsW
MEYTILTIIIATIPVILLLWYFWHRDKGEKEPMKLMKKVFLWGLIMVIPVAIVELILESISMEIGLTGTAAYMFVMPFLMVALPEELSKLWVVKKKAFGHKKFNEIMDGITYCILASMGFAVFENILYTFQFGVGTGIMRAFTAVPAHALFSGIMGYYIGLAKFSSPAKRKKLFKKGLLMAIFFHGLYDLLLLSGIPLLIFLIFPLLIYMWWVLNRAIKLANAGKIAELKYF